MASDIGLSNECSVGPRKLARLLVFALERTQKLQAKTQASDQVLPCANNANSAGANQSGQTDTQSKETPLLSETTSHIDGIVPTVLPHRPVEPQQDVVSSSTKGEMPVDDARPLSDPVPPGISPAQHFQFQSPSDREEHTSFLLVDDNAINMKVCSHPSSRCLFLATDAFAVLRCLHHT